MHAIRNVSSTIPFPPDAAADEIWFNLSADRNFPFSPVNDTCDRALLYSSEISFRLPRAREQQ